MRTSERKQTIVYYCYSNRNLWKTTKVHSMTGQSSHLLIRAYVKPFSAYRTLN